MKQVRNYRWMQEFSHNLRIEIMRCVKRISVDKQEDICDGNGLGEIKVEYTLTKTVLTMEINRTKNLAWQELCKELDKDIWDDAYRIVCIKMKRLPRKLLTRGWWRMLKICSPDMRQLKGYIQRLTWSVSHRRRLGLL